MGDVATFAGVSKQTVSAVVNGKPEITRATRDRVLAAIETLGYRRDFIASSLRTGRTRTIALIVSDTASPFIGTLAVAAEDYARECGYSLVLHNTHDEVAREAAYFINVVERGIDGVAFISATDVCSGLDVLRANGIPTVAIDRVPHPYEGAAVTLDNHKAGCLAAEHLRRLGHTRVAHISGPLTVSMSRERLGGFREALGDTAELTVEEAETWDYQAGYTAMQRLLAVHRPPLAVFAAADTLAIGAMRAICEVGLRVPEDVSVIGVDDIDSAAYQNPPLTTVRQSIHELAVLGLQLLLDILNGKEVAQAKVIMEPVLIVRQSTMAPFPREGGDPID